jgi:hypothetical protein
MQHGSHDLGEVTSWDDGGWLVVDTDLKPVGHQSTNWMVLLVLMVAMEALTSFGDDITSVHHGASHVLSVSGVALGHHGGGFEGGVGDLSNGELFVISLLSGDDGGV